MEANPRHVPDLSVLVPVYGVERYIADCARSLFAQRDVDAEFVFVDDASPDGSVDRLREVMAEYPTVGERVRILRHAHNRGVGAARRTAIEAARGTYICFVDSDDVLSDDRALAQLSEEARRTDADLIFGGYCEVSPAAAGGFTRLGPTTTACCAACSDRITARPTASGVSSSAVRFTRATACGLPRG